MANVCLSIEREAPEALGLMPDFFRSDLARCDTFCGAGDMFDARYRDASRMRLTELITLVFDPERRAFCATVPFKPPVAACGVCSRHQNDCACTYVLEFLSLEGPVARAVFRHKPLSEVAVHLLVAGVDEALRGAPLTVDLTLESGKGGMNYLRAKLPQPASGYQDQAAVPVLQQAYRLEDRTWTVYRPHYRVNDGLLLLASLASRAPANLKEHQGLRSLLRTLLSKSHATFCRMEPDVARAVESYGADEERELMQTAYTAVMLLAHSHEEYSKQGSVAPTTSVATRTDSIISELSGASGTYGFSVDVQTKSNARDPLGNILTVANTAFSVMLDMYPCMVNGSGLRLQARLPSEPHAAHVDALLKNARSTTIGISVRVTYVVKRV